MEAMNISWDLFESQPVIEDGHRIQPSDVGPETRQPPVENRGSNGGLLLTLSGVLVRRQTAERAMRAVLIVQPDNRTPTLSSSGRSSTAGIRGTDVRS